MRRRDLLGATCSLALASVTTLPVKSAARPLTIDRFERGSGRQPSIVMLYGSDGLTNSGRYETAARALVGAGYNVFLPRYFEATGEQRANYREINSKFAIWRQAIQGGVDDITKLPSVDAGRLAIVGFSLGGALALAISARDERIKAVVDFFGFLPEELRSARRIAPTLILHGDADKMVPVSNARDIAELLRSRGTAVEEVIYPGEGHGLSAGSLLDAGVRASAFLTRHM